MILDRMKPNIKPCYIRLPADIHRAAKLAAYSEGMSLQGWLADLISRHLQENVVKYSVLCHKDSVN